MTTEAKNQWQAFLMGMVACLFILFAATKFIPGGLGFEYNKIRQEAVDKGHAQWHVETDGQTNWSWK